MGFLRPIGSWLYTQTVGRIYSPQPKEITLGRVKELIANASTVAEKFIFVRSPDNVGNEFTKEEAYREQEQRPGESFTKDTQKGLVQFAQSWLKVDEELDKALKPYRFEIEYLLNSYDKDDKVQNLFEQLDTEELRGLGLICLALSKSAKTSWLIKGRSNLAGSIIQIHSQTARFVNLGEHLATMFQNRGDIEF